MNEKVAWLDFELDLCVEGEYLKVIELKVPSLLIEFGKLDLFW